MSSKLVTQAIPATGSIQVNGLNNFLMLVQTASAVTFRYWRESASDGEAENVEAGYVKGLVRPWYRCEIVGTAGATVRFLVGQEEIAEDFTDYRRTVGLFQQQISAAVQDAADAAVGAAAAQLVAANAARARVTVKLLNTADTNIRIGAQGTVAAARGLQLEPGQSYTYEGTARLDAIREGGTTAPVSILEELY